MAVGFGRLGLSPRSFWSMTLPEFAAAITGLTGRATVSTAPTRDQLAALMRQFPDLEGAPHD